MSSHPLAKGGPAGSAAELARWYYACLGCRWFNDSLDELFSLLGYSLGCNAFRFWWSLWLGSNTHCLHEISLSLGVLEGDCGYTLILAVDFLHVFVFHLNTWLVYSLWSLSWNRGRQEHLALCWHILECCYLLILYIFYRCPI